MAPLVPSIVSHTVGGSPVVVGSEAEDKQLQLSVMMEEYRALDGDIGRRVDLQHRNTNLGIVYFAAVTGYLFDYINDHSVGELHQSDLAVLLVLAPAIGLIFVCRHIDHDANIIDDAEYVELELRPRVIELVGHPDLLGFGRFLHASRLKRVRTTGVLWVLGNEHVVLLAYLTAYLVWGWSVRLGVSNRAGSVEGLSDALLYVSSAAFLVVVYMSVKTAARYAEVGSPSETLPLDRDGNNSSPGPETDLQKGADRP